MKIEDWTYLAHMAKWFFVLHLHLHWISPTVYSNATYKWTLKVKQIQTSNYSYIITKKMIPDLNLKLNKL